MDQEWLVCSVLCVLCLAAGMSVCVWAPVFQHDGIVLLVQRVWEWKPMSLMFWFLILGDIYICCPRCGITSWGGNVNFPSGSFFFVIFPLALFSSPWTSGHFGEERPPHRASSLTPQTAVGLLKRLRWERKGNFTSLWYKRLRKNVKCSRLPTSKACVHGKEWSAAYYAL